MTNPLPPPNPPAATTQWAEQTSTDLAMALSVGGVVLVAFGIFFGPLVVLVTPVPVAGALLARHNIKRIDAGARIPDRRKQARVALVVGVVGSVAALGLTVLWVVGLILYFT